MSNRWKRLRNVSVIPGLRVHTVPKVASTAILGAMPTIRRQAYPEEWGDEYRFMVVRHPLERLVSTWAFFLKDTRPNELTAIGYEQPCQFEEFLSYCLEIHDANQHTRAQWLYSGPWVLDQMVRYERLAEGWAELREQFPVLGDLPVKNRSDHDTWQGYYSTRMKIEAEKMFAADMALYEMAK